MCVCVCVCVCVCTHSRTSLNYNASIQNLYPAHPTLPLNALLIQNIKNYLLERSRPSHHLVLESNQY